jgi:hypothetical protein
MRKPLALVCVLTVFAAAPARGCGTGAEFAAVYLNADKAVDSADARFRCKFAMLANMMCVGRDVLMEQRNWRFVGRALTDAWNSGDERLRCAAGRVHWHTIGSKSAAELARPRPPLDGEARKDLDQLIRVHGDWCARELHPVGEGLKLNDCLSR